MKWQELVKVNIFQTTYLKALQEGSSQERHLGICLTVNEVFLCFIILLYVNNASPCIVSFLGQLESQNVGFFHDLQLKGGNIGSAFASFSPVLPFKRQMQSLQLFSFLDHIWSYMRNFLEKSLRIRLIINTSVYKYMHKLTLQKN